MKKIVILIFIISNEKYLEVWSVAHFLTKMNIMSNHDKKKTLHRSLTLFLTVAMGNSRNEWKIVTSLIKGTYAYKTVTLAYIQSARK